MGQLHAVIMAGGSGTRFWPASRSGLPKQFLPLLGDRSLLEGTIDRLRGLVPDDQIWVITNAKQAALIKERIPSFSMDRVIIEPEARDTAPCVALAAARIEASSPGSTLCFLPADHVIEPVEHFQTLIRRGAEIAGDDQTLVTFGIRPTHPATGYGYIEPAARFDDQEPKASHVERFREKPDLETAKEFLAGGRMLWNSGIFVWSYKALVRAMETSSPALATSTEAMRAALAANDLDQAYDAFRQTEKTSVDFAVMENAPDLAVLEADLRWDDLGSFLALDRVAPTDEHGNTRHLVDGAQDVVVDAKNNVIYADGKGTVTLFGVEDLVVVRVDDVTMVCPRDKTESIKQLQQRLKELGREDLL